MDPKPIEELNAFRNSGDKQLRQSDHLSQQHFEVLNLDKGHPCVDFEKSKILKRLIKQRKKG